MKIMKLLICSHDHNCDHVGSGGGVDNEKKSFVTRRPRLQRTCVRDTSHPGDTSFKYYTFNSTIFVSKSELTKC